MKADGTSVILNGLNLVPAWINSLGRTWKQDRYDTIAAKGFNSVRFVLYWDAVEPRDGEFD